MEKIHRAISIAALISEGSHIFCCVLPVLASLLGLIAVMGSVSYVPAGFFALHELIHAYEIPMIIFSGATLLAGWGLYAISIRMDCRNSGCCHEPCKPKKRQISRTLVIASILFFINITIYTLVHSSLGSGLFQ